MRGVCIYSLLIHVTKSQDSLSFLANIIKKGILWYSKYLLADNKQTLYSKGHFKLLLKLNADT